MTAHAGLFATLTDQQKAMALSYRGPEAIGPAILDPSRILVDEPIFAWRGKMWCHLFSEDLEELHAFARRLGLLRGWFQKPPKASWHHYDITASKRLQAIKMGAIPVDKYEASLVSKRMQGTLTPEWVQRIESIRARIKEEG